MVNPAYWSYGAESKDDTRVKNITFLVKQIRNLLLIVQFPTNTTVSITFAHWL